MSFPPDNTNSLGEWNGMGRFIPPNNEQEQGSKRTRGRKEERGPGLPLPLGYVPTKLDICSGRGKKNWNLEGNVAFRSYIQTKVSDYIGAQTKIEKTKVVVDILQNLRSQGFQFLKEGKDQRYYDIGDKEARDKVGHSLRDQVTAIKQKVRKDKEMGGHAQYEDLQLEDPCAQRRPSLTLSDSGNETEMRRSALESTELFKQFARRPSWLIGEDANASWEYVDQYLDMDIDSDSRDTQSTQQDLEIDEATTCNNQLMKNSILSFDERLSHIGSVNARMSLASRASLLNFSPSHRRSTMSGRSSLRMETNNELMRLSDVSFASGIFDEEWVT